MDGRLNILFLYLVDISKLKSITVDSVVTQACNIPHNSLDISYLSLYLNRSRFFELQRLRTLYESDEICQTV